MKMKLQYPTKAKFVLIVHFYFLSVAASQADGQSLLATRGEGIALHTANSQATPTVEMISSEIQSIKKEVISLNRDLRHMEEELLFPSATRYSVFVSLDIGKYFTLEAIKLNIDGKMVSSHVYSPKQRYAMTKGGIQKLHETNLNEGMHTITAFFVGLGPDGRPYKRASSVVFKKAGTSKFAELVVVDNDKTQEPEFKINQW